MLLALTLSVTNEDQKVRHASPVRARAPWSYGFGFTRDYALLQVTLAGLHATAKGRCRSAAVDPRSVEVKLPTRLAAARRVRAVTAAPESERDAARYVTADEAPSEATP